MKRIEAEPTNPREPSVAQPAEPAQAGSVMVDPAADSGTI
jgi:hypothetical protein